MCHCRPSVAQQSGELFNGDGAIGGKLMEQPHPPLERGFRAIEPGGCQPRRQQAGVRRPARVHRFDRGAVAEELEHTRGLAKRNAERGDPAVSRRASAISAACRAATRVPPTEVIWKPRA